MEARTPRQHAVGLDDHDAALANPLPAKLSAVTVPTVQVRDVADVDRPGCANSSLPCGDCRWSRGEDILINIEGAEELQVRASSILFEAACTSMQLPTRTH